MEKKEMSVDKTVKSIISKFIFYAILFWFIITFFSCLYSSVLNSISESHVILITACISLMLSIALYYLSHLLCRASTFDTFKIQKVSEENEKIILRRLNACFIIFIIISFVFSFILLKLSLNRLELAANISISQQSNTFSESYTQDMNTRLIERLNIDKTAVFVQYIVLQCGIIVSALSLVPYQKKMLKLYNK